MSAKKHIEKWGLIKPDSVKEQFYTEEHMIDFAESYAKELAHHKATTVGLYAFDKPLDDVFENIPEKGNCKTAVEAYLVHQIEYLKSIVFRIS
jgi:hypothetical protein